MTVINKKIKAKIPLQWGYFLRRKYLTFRGMYFRGKGYFCGICNKEYRKFFDGGFNLPIIEQMKIIGGGKREAIICPGCASNDRDRLIHLLLSSKDFEKYIHGKILHIAPEPSLYSWISQQQREAGNYHLGVKYHEGFYYPKTIPLMDLMDLPQQSDSFDLIICNHVLEHVENDEMAMKELFRVLKPGGKAILQVPWSPLLDETIEDVGPLSAQEREARFGQFDHLRLYGNDYPEILKKAGFAVDIFDYESMRIKDSHIDSMRLNPKECIFVGTKQDF